MSISRISAAMAAAGKTLLHTLIDRAQARDREDPDPIYIIIEMWVREVLQSLDLEAVFDSACADFGQYNTESHWLESLALLLEYNKSEAESFAQNLWRTYIFRLQDAPEDLWNQYPSLYREVAIETDSTLPRSWGDWVFPIQTFMGIVEANLLNQSKAFEDIIISEDALRLLEKNDSVEEPTPDLSEHTRETASISGQQVGVAAAITAYLTVCRDQIGSIDARGYPRSTSTEVPIDRIAIPLMLKEFVDTPPTTTIREKIAIRSKNGATPSQASDNQKIGPISDILKEERSLLILGRLGSGKTTLLRGLVLRHCQILLDREKNTLIFESGSDGIVKVKPARPLPLYVDLAEYIEEASGDETLEQFMFRQAADRTDDEGIISVLSSLAGQGDCLFLLDGLDQVADDRQRRRLLKQVSDASAGWAAQGNQILVTSRIEGYASAPLPERFKSYILQPIERSQIGSAIFRWTLMLLQANQPFLNDEEAQHKAQSQMMLMLREINQQPKLLALVANPLMLRLSVGSHQLGLRLSQNPTETYRALSDRLTGIWTSAVDSIALSDYEAISILSHLACWLQQSRPSGLLSREELRDIVGQVWRDLHPEAGGDEIGSAVDGFIRHAQDGDGVFIEMRPQRYGFIFQGVQAYFAARYLVSSFSLADERIGSRLYDPRWDEVIQLAVGFMALRSPEDASNLIEHTILGRAKATTYDPFLYRSLFFAAKLIGEGVEVRPGLAQRIATDLMTLWVNADRDSVGRFGLITQMVRDSLLMLKHTSAEQYAFSAACRVFAEGNNHQRSFAADALTFLPETYEQGIGELLKLERDLPPLLRRAVSGALAAMRPLPVDAYRLLLGYVSDGDSEVSHAAQEALRQAAPIPREALAMWVDFMRSGGPIRQRVSLRVLGQIGTLPKTVIDELVHLLKDPSRDLRQAAVKTLAGVTNLEGETLTAICRTAMDTNSEIRLVALGALRRPVLLPENVIDYLVEWTYDPEVRIRRASAEALGTCANDSLEVIEALVERLTDPADSVRVEAVNLLAKKGKDDPQIIHMLTHAARDPIQSVRQSVARAIGHFPTLSGDLHAALKLLIRDGEVIVREAALESVAMLHNPGEDIIDDMLIPLVKMGDSSVVGGKATAALAAGRKLPDRALTTLVASLPVHWEKQGHAIAACLKAHLPLTIETMNLIMDLAVAQSVGHTGATRVPSGLQALALEILGYTLESAPDMAHVLTEVAGRSHDPDIQFAALKGLSYAGDMWTGIRETLVDLLEGGSPKVQCAAAVTLAHLVRRLPDPPFTSDELRAIAEHIVGLLKRSQSRAIWEEGSDVQNMLFEALHRIVSRIRQDDALRISTQFEHFS